MKINQLNRLKIKNNKLKLYNNKGKMIKVSKLYKHL